MKDLAEKRHGSAYALKKKRGGEMPDTSRHKFGDIFQAKW